MSGEKSKRYSCFRNPLLVKRFERNLGCNSSVSKPKLMDIRGLHTRACKYNLSALETYFECEGVKPTNLNFT